MSYTPNYIFLLSLETLHLVLNICVFHCWGQSWRRGTKCDCKIDWLWVQSPFEEIKYLLTFIFSFLRSGVEAEVVGFRYSTRNASRTRCRQNCNALYTNILYQLHAVSRTQQCTQREVSIKILRSPLSAEFWRHCSFSGRSERRA